MSYHFLLDLALILLSTKILGLIAQKFQMPQVVGALIAGLLLSPAGLGLLSETEFTKQLSELGVIVLMFSAGMGTDINELKHSGKAGFMVAVLYRKHLHRHHPDGHVREHHGRNAQGDEKA